MHIPLKLALFGRESGARLGAEQLVELRRPEERIAFADLAEPPVLSINRDFSAPVVVEARRGADELAFLSGHDDDPFARYEALQQLMLETIIAGVKGDRSRFGAVIEAVGATLDDKALAAALPGAAVLSPSAALEIGSASCRGRVCEA